MRKLLLTGLLLSCAVLTLGCPKKKGDAGDAAADAAAEAADAEVDAAGAAAPAVVNAKNTADVARFPGETAVPDDDAKLAQLTAVRTSPKGGNVVATLKQGSDVTKVAEYQSNFLVTFPDPKDANTTLMGWIPTHSFTAAVIIHDAGVKIVDAAAQPVPFDAAAYPRLICNANAVAVVLGAAPVCKKKCTKDADCKGGAAGACANANALSGTVARACVND